MENVSHKQAQRKGKGERKVISCLHLVNYYMLCLCFQQVIFHPGGVVREGHRDNPSGTGKNTDPDRLCCHSLSSAESVLVRLWCGFSYLAYSKTCLLYLHSCAGEPGDAWMAHAHPE